ncbi:hypothetical protein F5883DRAFT_355772, partial [Diaporthe sp. PMI_573]
TKSPLYSVAYNEVIRRTCSALSIPFDRFRLLAIQKWTKSTALVFDIFHDDYDSSTTHRKSYIRIASPEFREFVSDYVARQHNFPGWDRRPELEIDRT